MGSSLLGSYLIDKFGRKATIMLCSVPFVIGWVTIAAAKSTLLLLLGRFITGVALGVISLTVPVRKSYWQLGNCHFGYIKLCVMSIIFLFHILFWGLSTIMNAKIWVATPHYVEKLKIRMTANIQVFSDNLFSIYERKVLLLDDVP